MVSRSVAGKGKGRPGLISGRRIEDGGRGRVRGAGARGFPRPGPGPKHPRSRPRGTDSRVANFPVPAREPHVGRASRWALPASPRGQGRSLPLQDLPRAGRWRRRFHTPWRGTKGRPPPPPRNPCHSLWLRVQNCSGSW